MKEQSKVLKLIARIMKINNSNIEEKVSITYSGAYDREILNVCVYDDTNQVSFYKGYLINSKKDYDLSKKREIINEVKRLERLVRG